MRLIDADALIEFWKADFTEEERSKLHIPLNVAIENIKDAPTVKPIKVVRCKDCAFFFEFKNHDADLGDGYCDWLDKYVGLDKYCAYGMTRGESNE